MRGPGLADITPAPVVTPVVKPAVVAPAATQAYAYVVVQLPEDAVLYLGGNRTQESGAVRKFKIPVSDSNAQYAYDIKAELIRDGRTYVAATTEQLKAGETVSVKVNDVAVAVANR